MSDSPRPKSDARDASDDIALRYVVVEGCIGVGKTTLTHLAAERLGARTVLEQFEDNPFLPDFYKDQAAHAFKTQMWFLLSRFKQQEQMVQSDLFYRALVTDYMFAKDRIFAALTLAGSEMALYDQVFTALKTRIKQPDVVIHLTAPLDVITERIRRRGREYERDMDMGYLARLVDAYAEFFHDFDDCPVLTVDTASLNFPERDEDTTVVLDAARALLQKGERKARVARDTRQPELV